MEAPRFGGTRADECDPDLGEQGCIRRTSLPPGVGGEHGFIAGFGEKGVQRGYHLCSSPYQRRPIVRQVDAVRT
jgi:hypothetical protein